MKTAFSFLSSFLIISKIEKKKKKLCRPEIRSAMGQYGPNSIAAESAGTTRHGPNLSKRSKGGLGALNFIELKMSHCFYRKFFIIFISLNRSDLPEFHLISPINKLPGSATGGSFDLWVA